MVAKLPDLEREQAGGEGARALQELVAASFGAAAQRFELRRDGLSPCVFEGRLIAEASSVAPGSRLWYELAAYARTEGGYVASLKVFKKAVAEKDIFWARTFQTVAELLAYFETHDPARDVTAPDDLTDARLATVEAMIGAVALRQRIDEARSEYHSAAGELLTAVADVLAI
jgi:hypothetical protein